MYSRLNTLVNEINALGLNQVKDEEINRKILRSLRKPDYDIINTVLQKEDLVKLTPNQVINQIIALFTPSPSRVGHSGDPFNRSTSS